MKKQLIQRTNPARSELLEVPDAYQKLPPVLTAKEERDLFRALDERRDNLRDILSHHPLIIIFYRHIHTELTEGNKSDVSRFINLKRAVELKYPAALHPRHLDEPDSTVQYDKGSGAKVKFSQLKLRKEWAKLQKQLEKAVGVQFKADLRAMEPLIAEMQDLWVNSIERDEEGAVNVDCEAYQRYVDILDGLARLIEKYPLRRKHQKPIEDKIAELSAPLLPENRQMGMPAQVSDEYRVDYERDMDPKEIRRVEGVLMLPVSAVQDRYRRLCDRQNKVTDLEHEVVTRNIKLSIVVARGVAIDNDEFCELIQEGIVGMKSAAELFRYTSGNKFVTYATWWVRQAIERAVEDKTGLPNYLAGLIKPIHAIYTRLGLTLDDEISPEIIFEHITAKKAKLSGVIQVINYMKSRKLSYDKLPADEFTGVSSLLSDQGEASERSLDVLMQDEISDDIELALQGLTYQERCIIILSFGIGQADSLSQEEIGKIFRISRPKVKESIDNALAKLRDSHMASILLDHIAGTSVSDSRLSPPSIHASAVPPRKSIPA